MNYLTQGGVSNMERLNSMPEKEIMSIPGIRKASYRYIQEALEDFRAEFGNRTWVMPDFDEIETGYIIQELARYKLPHYYNLVLIFQGLAQDEYHHPQMEVMEQIYYKLHSIHRDEFAAIMAGKNVNIDDYGI